MTALLPEGFAKLEPYVDAWVQPTAALRDAARTGQPPESRAAFFAAMAPLLASALAHLDQTPLAAHSPEDQRLSLLTLAFAHVANAQDVQGPDEARHAINRRRLPITAAPADM
jgi:hypothetical protein